MEEIWKTVVGHPDYEVSNLGRCRSLKGGSIRIVDGCITQSGYRKVAFTKNGKTVGRQLQRVMAEAFWGTVPDKMMVNHKDANPLNNNLSNLEVVYIRENANHSCNRRFKTPRGVRKRRQRYCASIEINGRSKVLGTFDTEAEAAQAYLNAVKNLKQSKYADGRND